jgi:hypothetical protein
MKNGIIKCLATKVIMTREGLFIMFSFTLSKKCMGAYYLQLAHIPILDLLHEEVHVLV